MRFWEVFVGRRFLLHFWSAKSRPKIDKMRHRGGHGESACRFRSARRNARCHRGGKEGLKPLRIRRNIRKPRFFGFVGSGGGERRRSLEKEERRRRKEPGEFTFESYSRSLGTRRGRRIAYAHSAGPRIRERGEWGCEAFDRVLQARALAECSL